MSTNDVVGVGVIGASLRRGWGGLVHLPSLEALPGFRIAAVCASSEDSARATGERYGAAGFTDALKMIEHPDVDLVSVCVRSSIHYELVKAALQAGKHVYCEWPLVESTAKGRELAELARQMGVATAVGLQARCAPTVLKARDLIRDGYLGEVVSCSAYYSSMTNGSGVDSSRAYMVDAASGVGLLEIHGGHVLDTIAFCLGRFDAVSSMLAVRHPTVTVQDTGEQITRTAPDQILVNAALAGGTVASVHIQGGKINDNGFLLRIQGSDGDLELRTRGNHAVQIETLELRGASGAPVYAHHEAAGHRFQPARPLDQIEVDAEYSWIPEHLREQPFYNTAQLYAKLGEQIRGSATTVPDFDVAVELLELIDAVKESAANGSCQRSVTGALAAELAEA
jgi:predicted dehydrogenase